MSVSTSLSPRPVPSFLERRSSSWIHWDESVRAVGVTTPTLPSRTDFQARGRGRRVRETRSRGTSFRRRTSRRGPEDVGVGSAGTGRFAGRRVV